MKKIILFIVSICVATSMYSQAPQKINYQAVLRDNGGAIIDKSDVGLKIEIIAESNDNVVYTEIHKTTTNEYGLINFQIGTGDSTDDFSNILWGTDSYKVQISFDEQGTGDFKVMGSSPLSSVPYALHAYDTETKQQLSIDGNVISLSEGGSVTIPEAKTFSGSFNDLTDVPANLDLDYTNDFSGNYNDLANQPSWSDTIQNYISNTAINDNDTINEIQDLQLIHNVLSITKNETATKINLAPYVGTNTDEQVLSLNGTDLSITNGNTIDVSSLKDGVDDADNDPGNEIQDLTLSGTTLMLSDDVTTVDLSILQDGTGTDDQTISLSNNILTLEDGGSVNLSTYLDNTDTQLTEAEVDAFVGNNGYISSEVDGSVTNELQDLSLSGTTLMLSDDATNVDLSAFLDNTDTQLTEAEVDAFVGNNGYITGEVDGSVTNELQDLTLSGTTLMLSDDATTVDLSVLQDGTGTDNQTISLTNNILTLEDGGSVNLSAYLDNTDTQLTENEVDTYVSNNGYITSEVDGSVTNELQDLSLSGTTLMLSDDATTVDLSVLQDGTGTDDQTLAEVLGESNDAGTANITNLADPVNDQDAATKAYVDMLKSQIETLENSMIEAGTYKLQDVDGNQYDVVKIGDQVWMAENLRVTHYPDGTEIPTVSDDNSSGSTNDEWAALADDHVSDAYCLYNDNASGEGDTYGVLYTYAAAIGDNWAHDIKEYQGVCPDGWHLPSDSEFSELNNALSYPFSGADLKEDGLIHWASPNTNANNSSGFTGLPGGSRRYSNGTFDDLTQQGNFWTRSIWNATDAVYYFLKYNSAEFFRGTTIYSTNKSNGYSVRCVKD